MIRENDLNIAAKEDGVWASRHVAPNEFFESSAEISVAAPYTGVGALALVFAATADNADIAYSIFETPDNFRISGGGIRPSLLFTLHIASISTNAIATTANTFEVQFVVRPGPTATDRAEFTLGYYDVTLNATTVADPPVNYGEIEHVDLVDKMTAAQRLLLVPGTVVVAKLRPKAAVATNTAIVVSSGRWSWKEHLKRTLTATV